MNTLPVYEKEYNNGQGMSVFILCSKCYGIILSKIIPDTYKIIEDNVPIYGIINRC